jgi:hypothetical protein
VQYFQVATQPCFRRIPNQICGQQSDILSLVDALEDRLFSLMNGDCDELGILCEEFGFETLRMLVLEFQSLTQSCEISEMMRQVR